MQNANNPRSHDEAGARVEGLKVHHNSPASTPGSRQDVGKPQGSVARPKTEHTARGPQIAKSGVFFV